MTLSIHTNVASEYVSRNINRYSSAFIKTIGRIGSGEQIQSAADDAAGLALSSKLKVNIRSWQKTIQTISSGIDMLKTAEDALVSQSEALTKMKSLVLQGANGLLTNSDKDNINNELSELLKSINEISNNSIFNGQNILQNIKTEGSYTYTDQTGALSDINATSMTINSNNPITLGTHKLEVTGIDAIITNIDTSGIVGEIESAYGPKWGDNNTLYFIMNDNDGGNALYSINKNGSGLTKVTGPIGGSGIREFDVSQQGYIAVILENGDVYAKRGGTVFTQVATNSLSANDGISWNAAGDKFVYRGTTITQLHIYDFNTSTNTTLNLGSAVNNPFWNWSDNKIYYRVFASGAGRIGSINPDGSGQNNSTYNLAGGDYWPTLRNGNFASGSTINMDASSIIYSNQGANFSGYNPEISPDGTLIASIVPTTAGNTNNIQIHTIAGAVSQASINDNSLKNSLFNVSPYIAANADVGTDIYTFTYSESSNTWTVKNSDNVTIDSGLSGGTLHNVGNLGLMVNIKNTTRLRDGDTFTISTEALAKITLDANSDYSYYTVYDFKDDTTTVTAKDGSYVELKFATGGPKVGSYTFTVSGTQSETYNSIEINTDNTLKSKLDIGLPLNFTTKSLNIDNVSVGNTLFSKEMLNMVDNAMSKIVQERGKIGATINRLTQALDLAEEQLLAAQRSYSAIADADISYETILNSITKNFLQSNIAMLYGSTINSNAIAGLLNSSNDFKDFDLMGN